MSDDSLREYLSGYIKCALTRNTLSPQAFRAAADAALRWPPESPCETRWFSDSQCTPFNMMRIYTGPAEHG